MIVMMSTWNDIVITVCEENKVIFTCLCCFFPFSIAVLKVSFSLFNEMFEWRCLRMP